MIRTNLHGPFLCCRAFLRQRRGRTGSNIANVTSVHEAIPSVDDADDVTGQSFTIDGGLEMDGGQGA